MAVLTILTFRDPSTRVQSEGEPSYHSVAERQTKKGKTLVAARRDPPWRGR